MQLDAIDLRILAELQQNGALTNVELARRVHLSPSPCLARVKALEAGGVIERYVALASAKALGLGLNVFINISPGRSFQYRVEIPDDHPQGLHWYHSHLHEFVDPQILSGLSGMLIVAGGIESHYPSLAGLRERVMVLKDINLPGSTSPARTVNGLTNTNIAITAEQVAVPGTHTLT